MCWRFVGAKLDRAIALPTLPFFPLRSDLEFTTAPVFPLSSELSPCSLPAKLTAQQQFELLLTQLDQFDDINETSTPHPADTIEDQQQHPHQQQSPGDQVVHFFKS
jgi:hypothetical protein